MRSSLLILANAPLLQPLAHWLYRTRHRTNHLPHPFDVRKGIDTGGFLPASLLGTPNDAYDITAYSGCMPSTLATALKTIPALDRACFVDLGCGKGRALIVARDFPFRKITGIEMNPQLVRTARTNARIVQSAYPAGPQIDVVQDDASAPPLMDNDVVYFLYHPFGHASTAKLCAHLAAQADASWRLFVVYENPVHGDVFDAEPRFSRWFAATLPTAPEETPFGRTESIVIWTNRMAGPSHFGADGRIVITKPNIRADIQS